MVPGDPHPISRKMDPLMRFDAGAGASRVAAESTTCERFNSLLATSKCVDLRQTLGCGKDAPPVKKPEGAAGKMITALGKSRYGAGSEYAAGVVSARATTGIKTKS